MIAAHESIIKLFLCATLILWVFILYFEMEMKEHDKWYKSSKNRAPIYCNYNVYNYSPWPHPQLAESWWPLWSVLF